MKYVILLLILIPSVSAIYATPSWNANNCSKATSFDEFYACGNEERKLVEKFIEYYNITNDTPVRLHLAPENEPYFPLGKTSGDINESAVAYAFREGPLYMGGAWPCNDGAQLEKYAENGYTRYECYQTRYLAYKDGIWRITQNAYWVGGRG